MNIVDIRDSKFRYNMSLPTKRKNILLHRFVWCKDDIEDESYDAGCGVSHLADELDCYRRLDVVY